MPLMTIGFLFCLGAALLYVQRVDRNVKYKLAHSGNQSDNFQVSLLEQTKALKLIKFGLVAMALVVLTFYLLKQIFITMIILVVAGVFISMATKKMNHAKQLSQDDSWNQ